jgi:hypothetical protein
VVSNKKVFLNFDQSEHIMGPGSHVGFPISAKNDNLVYDHPMNISAKFDSNLFCGFRKKDEHVKFHRPCELLSWVSVRRPSVRPLAFHI